MKKFAQSDFCYSCLNLPFGNIGKVKDVLGNDQLLEMLSASEGGLAKFNQALYSVLHDGIDGCHKSPSGSLCSTLVFKWI